MHTIAILDVKITKTILINLNHIANENFNLNSDIYNLSLTSESITLFIICEKHRLRETS